MNLYADDLSMYNFNYGFSDLIAEPLSYHHRSSASLYFDDADDNHPKINYADTSYNDHNNSNKESVANPVSPPKHRHDGKSPLPLGMDWSAPPRKWDGRDIVWPHDPQTGWSYCVTIPSWVFQPKLKGSDPVVFYRVQVGIQSPEGITTTRGILRRFSDFLKLLYELKREFPKKTLPAAPPKRFLGTRSRTLFEERRCCLEDWMGKLLSDIEISRSAPVAIFLELEAAARSSFDDVDQQNSDAHSLFTGVTPSFLLCTNSDVSEVAGSSSVASEHENSTRNETSEPGFPSGNAGLHTEDSASEQCVTDPHEINAKYGMSNTNILLENQGRFSKYKLQTGGDSSSASRDGLAEKVTGAFHRDRAELLTEERPNWHVRRLSSESTGSDLSSLKASEISNFGVSNLFGDGSLDQSESAEAHGAMDTSVNADFHVPRDLVIVLPSDERHKFNRVLRTMQQRLATAKTDVEDLLARLNQEVAVRQFLTTKVKDLEVELETTRESCKENIQQAALIEKERFTQTQWDMEELRKQCLEMELTLKSVQDEKLRIASAKASLLGENKMLLQELDATRLQLENLHKCHEELEVKSKADVKLLVKEVKSLRSSQSELKQELGCLMKEKLEVERVLQKEKQQVEDANTANAKLLHECEILRSRLQECSVNFLIEEDKLIVDTSSPSDALDLLTTSDNRIGLLVAEAQLLAQEVETITTRLDETQKTNDSDERTDDELRKVLADILVDNAKLRKQLNSVLRCTLNTMVKSDNEEEEDEETPLRKTVLSKFLER